MLKSLFPWTSTPLILSAPMLHASTPHLAISVSLSGGLGFLAISVSLSGGLGFLAISVSLSGGLGFLASGPSPSHLQTQLSTAKQLLSKRLSDSKQKPLSIPNTKATKENTLPIGVGFQLFASSIDALAPVIAAHNPAAVWLFAPRDDAQLRTWAQRIRDVTNGATKICVQVCSVAEAERSLAATNADFLVLQGSDAGGHGSRHAASIVSLVPEVKDRLAAMGRADVPVVAAGGIADGRGVAGAVALGGDGVAMGTRFLASEECGVAEGWKGEVVRVGDGGVATVRSTLCDRLKGNGEWPDRYDGRMIRNKGHEDEEAGMGDEENVRLYKEELRRGDEAWGAHGRMVAYAGTGVGLVRSVQRAGSIVEETRRDAGKILERLSRNVNGLERSQL